MCVGGRNMLLSGAAAAFSLCAGKLRPAQRAALHRFTFLQNGTAAVGMINFGAFDIINDLPLLRFLLTGGNRRQCHCRRALFPRQNQNSLLLILRKNPIRIAAAEEKHRKQNQYRRCRFSFHYKLPPLPAGIYLTNSPSLRYNKKQQFSTTLKQRRNRPHRPCLYVDSRLLAILRPGHSRHP